MNMEEIRKMKGEHESEASWQRRKKFLIVFRTKYPKDRLNTLSYCYVNVLLYGCRYSETLMDDLYERACEVANYQWEDPINMSKWTEIFEEKEAENNMYASLKKPLRKENSQDKQCLKSTQLRNKSIKRKSSGNLQGLKPFMENEFAQESKPTKSTISSSDVIMQLSEKIENTYIVKKEIVNETSMKPHTTGQKLSHGSITNTSKFDFNVMNKFQFTFKQEYLCPVVKIENNTRVVTLSPATLKQDYNSTTSEVQKQESNVFMKQDNPEQESANHIHGLVILEEESKMFSEPDIPKQESVVCISSKISKQESSDEFSERIVSSKPKAVFVTPKCTFRQANKITTGKKIRYQDKRLNTNGQNCSEEDSKGICKSGRIVTLKSQQNVSVKSSINLTRDMRQAKMSVEKVGIRKSEVKRSDRDANAACSKYSKKVIPTTKLMNTNKALPTMISKGPTKPAQKLQTKSPERSAQITSPKKADISTKLVCDTLMSVLHQNPGKSSQSKLFKSETKLTESQKARTATLTGINNNQTKIGKKKTVSLSKVKPERSESCVGLKDEHGNKKTSGEKTLGQRKISVQNCNNKKSTNKNENSTVNGKEKLKVRSEFDKKTNGSNKSFLKETDKDIALKSKVKPNDKLTLRGKSPNANNNKQSASDGEIATNNTKDVNNNTD